MILDVRREVILANISRPVINLVYIPIPKILANIYRFILELAASKGLKIG